MPVSIRDAWLCRSIVVKCKKSRKAYTRTSPFFVVELKRTDSYKIVISKMCKVIGIDESETGDMRLINSKEAILPDQRIALRGKETDWTLGGFLLKRHSSPDKVTLGVGPLEELDCTSMYSMAIVNLNFMYSYLII